MKTNLDLFWEKSAGVDEEVSKNAKFVFGKIDVKALGYEIHNAQCSGIVESSLPGVSKEEIFNVPSYKDPT